MGNMIAVKSLKIALVVVLSSTPLSIASIASAQTCDQVCAAAGEPGYNKATDGAIQTICCCQPDSGSQTFTNHPESECAGVNPQATPTPGDGQ
jgi:hypothetical protein